MEYAYERLGRLVDYLVTTPGDSLSLPGADTLQNQFMEETLNIKTYLNRRSLLVENEKNFELTVDQYQKLIASWLDVIYEARCKENFKWPEPLFQLVTRELLALIKFMYDRYERFFNLDAKVSMIFLDESNKGLDERIRALRHHLLKEDSNETLTELALAPLTDLLNPAKKKKITYRNFLYAQRIEKALSAFGKEKFTGSGCDDKPLIELLVLMNYNNPEVKKFIINKIMVHIEMATTLQSRINRLQFFLKEFIQFKERPNMAFCRFSESLKNQIVTWISVENGYYLESVSLPVEEVQSLQKKPIAAQKLQVSVAVDVLSILFRAAKDTNVITNKHKTEVYKNISHHIRTPQSEIVSVNSLTKKSYVPEERVKHIAIDLLHSMIKKIHEH